MTNFQMFHEIVNRNSSYSRKFKTRCENFEIHIYYNSQENINDLKEILEEMNKTFLQIET